MVKIGQLSIIVNIYRTRDDEKMTSFPKSCICIFLGYRPTQNLTGWKRWVDPSLLLKKLTSFDEILR